MELGQSSDRVAEVAICVVKEDDGAGAGLRRGNPPSMELGGACVGGGEGDGLEGEAVGGRRASYGGFGVVKKLPTALPEDQAERPPDAEQCANKDEAHGGGEPPARDSGMLRGSNRLIARRLAAYGVFWLFFGIAHLGLQERGGLSVC